MPPNYYRNDETSSTVKRRLYHTKFVKFCMQKQPACSAKDAEFHAKIASPLGVHRAINRRFLCLLSRQDEKIRSSTSTTVPPAFI